MVPEGYISTTEAAKILGCSRRYVGNLLKDGRVQGSKILDRWLVKEKSLSSFTLKGHKTSPGRKPKARA